MQVENINNDEQVKILAFNLPQFHECEENNEWWGKGFTEWTNTRSAEKIYGKHNQPREPLNDYYYDLSKLEDVLNQMKLAKQYGVYGFCYYHYWFCGKLLLNRPLEMLRDYNGEKLPYCFCWANESWTRTWKGDKTFLLKQEYGGKEDWENHFLYLLTFFKDDNYIKIEEQPMLVLYRTKNIPDCDEMIAYWNERCVQEGFKGIYIVEELNCFQDKTYCKDSKAFLEFEPLYTMTFASSRFDKWMDKLETALFNIINKSHNQIYSYGRLWRNIIKRSHNLGNGKECFLGAFVDWDNTARKGNYGRIVLGTSPKKFCKFMRKQHSNAKAINSSYVFINAWNEWGEGTYLEPDKKHGYRYLETISQIVER